MTRRLAGVLVCFVALLALDATSAGAEALEGPQVTVPLISFRTLQISLLAIDPDDSRTDVLLSSSPADGSILDPASTPVWSPDGTTLAIAATSPGKEVFHGVTPMTSIFLFEVGSRKLHLVKGTAGGSDPVFSPDGATLAFTKTRELRNPNGKLFAKPRFQSSSAWITGVDGSSLRRLTPWQNGLSISPSSFSRDGLMLAATREVGRRPQEAVALPLDGSPIRVLARPGEEPTYSPDGAKIAYLSRSRTTPFDVFEMNADGSEPVPLTETPRQGEIGLAWSPSGARLAFVRVNKPAKGAGAFGLHSAVIEMNADGSCERSVFSKPQSISFGVSWRPGPGRDPGPIVC